MVKFSVLMSVYRNEKPEFLKQALDSVIEQTIPPTEIVIVKDGCLTTELDDLICLYESRNKEVIKVISFEKNRGLGLALRDGVKACAYEYIARMDTDDISNPDRFKKQFDYLEKNPDIALLGSWVKEFSKNPEHPDTITMLPCENADIIEFSKRRNPFRHMTVIFKKQAVLDSGNYRDCIWFEDYDLWVRMITRGYTVANLPEFLVDVRADGEMFARRGGFNYLRQDIRFQKMLLDSNYINGRQYIINVIVRSFVRLVPNSMRVWIYKNLLRK